MLNQEGKLLCQWTKIQFENGQIVSDFIDVVLEAGRGYKPGTLLLVIRK